VSGVLDRLEGLVREVREYRSDYDVTAAIDSLSSAMIELLPLLRAFDEAEAAWRKEQRSPNVWPSKACGDAAERCAAAERALLAALRTAPAGEAP
jgi:hypothetical protein